VHPQARRAHRAEGAQVGGRERAPRGQGATRGAVREGSRGRGGAHAQALAPASAGPRHAAAQAHEPRVGHRGHEGVALMGQKTHPIGFRLGIVKTWDSRLFAKRNYAELLKEDLLIKRYLKKRLYQAGISKITIERKGDKVTIGIRTARPGLVIGRKGEQVDKLSEEMKQLTKKPVQLNIEEIK